MDIGKIVTLTITFILVFAAAFYSINAIWPNTRSINAVTNVSGPYGLDIATVQTVATSDQLADPFFRGSGGSLIFYLYLNTLQRTSNMNDPYVTILGIPNSFALQVMPGAARISLFTQKAGTGQIESEFIDLQRIPEQKWVQIAILREGRRFDVLYNTTLVASHRMKYIPVVQKSGLLVGAEGVTGVIGNVRVAARRLTVQEIQYEHTRTSDTRGKPSLGSILPPKGLATTLCTGPHCPAATSNSPQNTLQFWSSPYR
jgi:hypothetical protein